MSRHISPLLLSTLTILLLASACMPAAPAPATASVNEGQVATMVAATIAAHETEAIINASPTFTETPPPTEPPAPTLTVTPTVIFPTLTPFATSTSSAPNVIVTTTAPYQCTVTKKTPADNTVFKPNQDFDIKFSIWNTGTKDWDAGADLLFDSGTNLLDPDHRYELPKVKSGTETGPFLFDAKAPKKPGTYTMVFKVQGINCYPYITIIVKK